MSRRANVLVLVVLLGIVTGLVVAYIPRVRAAAACSECRINLMQMAFGFSDYHACNGSFPPGTIPNADLSPERRLSWLVGGWSYFGDGQVELLLDMQGAWDDEGNRLPQIEYLDYPNGWKRRPLGDFRTFLCPSNPARTSPPPTHYVGVAGVGPDAAAWGVGYPNNGVFGYDRRTKLEDITDGATTTMLLIETNRDNGPWTAGGPSTVRGLDPAGGPYPGAGGQFGSGHRGTAGGSPRPPYATNVLFADGSVRSLTDGVRPEVFEALATIAGGEAMGPIGAD
jgi:prepilin-type processing-associated H-X9-DG protein